MAELEVQLAAEDVEGEVVEVVEAAAVEAQEASPLLVTGRSE